MGSEMCIRDRHKDVAVASEGEKAPAYQLLKFVIQTGCKAAIKVAEKI